MPGSPPLLFDPADTVFACDIFIQQAIGVVIRSVIQGVESIGNCVICPPYSNPQLSDLAFKSGVGYLRPTSELCLVHVQHNDRIENSKSFLKALSHSSTCYICGIKTVQKSDFAVKR